MDLQYEIRLTPERIKIKKGVYHPARLTVINGNDKISVPLPEAVLKDLLYDTTIGWWIRGVQDAMRTTKPFDGDEKDNAAV